MTLANGQLRVTTQLAINWLKLFGCFSDKTFPSAFMIILTFPGILMSHKMALASQQKQKGYFNSGNVISVATYLTQMWLQTEPLLIIA